MKTFVATAFAGTMLLGASIAQACPELEGVDFASSIGDDKYEVLLEEDAVVSREELKDVPFLYENYERCQGHITHAVVKATSTGRIFYGLWSNEDTCDGGNAYGALFRLQEKVADVGDSQVSCDTQGSPARM